MRIAIVSQFRKKSDDLFKLAEKSRRILAFYLDFVYLTRTDPLNIVS